LLPVFLDTTSEVITVLVAAPVMSPALDHHLPKGKVVIRGAMTMPLLRQVIKTTQ